MRSLPESQQNRSAFLGSRICLRANKMLQILVGSKRHEGPIIQRNATKLILDLNELARAVDSQLGGFRRTPSEEAVLPGYFVRSAVARLSAPVSWSVRCMRRLMVPAVALRSQSACCFFLWAARRRPPRARLFTRSAHHVIVVKNEAHCSARTASSLMPRICRAGVLDREVGRCSA